MYTISNQKWLPVEYIMQNNVTTLFKSKKTIFTPQDLLLLWQIKNPDYLKTKIYRLIKNKQLIRLKRGVYALDDSYDRYELANKLITPSYVSLRTILAKSGAIFQYDSRVSSVASYNRELNISGQKYIYKKVKNGILFDNRGIVNIENKSYASPERALDDLLYLEKNASVDNLDNINLEKCLTFAKIYKNKSLEKRIQKLKGWNVRQK